MVATERTDGGWGGSRKDIGDLIPALDLAPVAIVVTDPRRPDNPLVYANAEFTRITGYRSEELEGQSLRRLQGPATDPAAIACLRSAVADGRDATVELVNYRKTGEPFWMRVQVRPVLAPSGIPVAFVGVLADITECRRSEEASRRSEERLRAVIDAVPLPMLLIQPGGIIVQANASAHRTLGVASGALSGRDVTQFATADGNGGARLRGMLSADGPAWREEMRIRCADGQVLWMLASAQPFSVRDEALYLLVFQDVTELKRKEQALTQANEEAEKTIRARMRFLAAASHDLRQPLQALALFASALDPHLQSAQARSIMQSCKLALRGMEEMFDALMDMSKLDAGVMKAEPRVFVLNDVFEQLEATYGSQADAAGLRLSVVASSATVRSDPGLLARILGNFLSNAIRYTREGHIVVGARRKGGEVWASVCDTGPGIPESRRLEIFREFRQGASPTVGGRTTGVGLGLSIVQRLARLLNHRLDVRSMGKRGSCFSVAVPLAEEARPAAAAPAEEEEGIRDIAGATVVVIDDDPDIQEGLEMILTDWGCQPVVAATADKALEILVAGKLTPDVILADLHLHEPGAGVEAIRAVRAHTGAPAPAFLFTGDTEVPGGCGLGLEFLVLRKPLDPLRLRSMLADALGR
ncbi:MAG: PAS domain S-box protein [Magnetospirillum sp.]|nr:PAS domain S-box protein [Magnetospirillum sp.]